MTASQHAQPLDVATPEARATLAAVYAHLVRLARQQRAEAARQVCDTYQPESKPPLVDTPWQEP